MRTMLFENPTIKEILKHYRVIWALGHARGLMGWDSETYMPRMGVEERSIAAAEIAVLSQKLLLEPKFVELVEKASSMEGLNEYERGVVRVLERAIRIYKKLPPSLVAEKAATSQKAKAVWREAKEKNDFDIFKPYLAKLVELNRQTAEYLGYEEHPYDALLDLYEEGLKTREMERIYDAIIPASRSVLEKVLEEGYYPQHHPLEDERYDAKALEEVNRRILDLLGYPWDRGRLDVSAHPFTSGIGVRDVRITTRYEGFDFKRSLLAVIHEYGHALYNLQIDERFIATPLAGGASMGVHESQSRFWENMIGRTRVFVETMYPLLREKLPLLEKYEAEEVYRYFNTVRPSLIRVEADEVTYNFHTLLRFELEKQLITGEISVDEVPELWADTLDRFLGVKPRSHAEGVLQDIHWSMGAMGYFPTYTLGNVIAAQLRAHILRELPNLDELVRNAEFKPIQEWLREKIHRWGSMYPPQELLAKKLGEPLNPEYFAKYLVEKYVDKRI